VVGHDIALVIFDPCVAFLSRECNANSDADVRQVLAPLRALCEQAGCAAVLLRYLNKQSMNTNALYRGGGSIGFISAARSGLLAARDPEDDERLVLAHSKANLSRKAPSLAYRLHPVQVPDAGEQVRVEWLGETHPEASDLLQARSQGRSEQREECADWLRERLAGGNAVSFKLLRTEAEGFGWGERLVQRAGHDIGVDIQRGNRAGGGTLWSLKTLSQLAQVS
jgi:hypothetical protein